MVQKPVGVPQTFSEGLQSQNYFYNIILRPCVFSGAFEKL